MELSRAPAPALPFTPWPQNAEQQGPQRASKLAWVVRPELRQQFRLPEELPADIQETLAASVKAPKPEGAPKGLGTKLPAKKEGKKKAPAPDAGSPGGSGDAAKPPKPQKTPRERGPMVRVEAKKLEVSAGADTCCDAPAPASQTH